MGPLAWKVITNHSVKNNLQTKHVSLQFHVVYHDDFSSVNSTHLPSWPALFNNLFPHPNENCQTILTCHIFYLWHLRSKAHWPWRHRHLLPLRELTFPQREPCLLQREHHVPQRTFILPQRDSFLLQREHHIPERTFILPQRETLLHHLPLLLFGQREETPLKVNSQEKCLKQGSGISLTSLHDYCCIRLGMLPHKKHHNTLEHSHYSRLNSTI